MLPDTGFKNSSFANSSIGLSSSSLKLSLTIGVLPIIDEISVIIGGGLRCCDIVAAWDRSFNETVTKVNIDVTNLTISPVNSQIDPALVNLVGPGESRLLLEEDSSQTVRICMKLLIPMIQVST